MIYFDNAATTLQKPVEVEQAVLQAFHSVGNAGRGAHEATLAASRMIYDTRVQLAKLFHIADAERIAFAANATEALNIAIQGIFRAGDRVVTTVCEHNSVLRPFYLCEQAGVQVTYMDVDIQGRLDYQEIKKQVTEGVRAVVVTHASNVTGNIMDLATISSIAHEAGAILIVDASQTAGCLPIDVEALGIDVLCFTGHKGLFGPQGTGGIYVRDGLDVRPLKVGGSGIDSFNRQHPDRYPTALEAGTLNGHGIAGLHAALEWINRVGVEAIHRKEMALAERFLEGVRNLENVELYGSQDIRERVAIVSLNIGGYDSAEVSDCLWEDYGICVRPGAHCAPLMHKALGTERQGVVRFSFSYFNTEKEVDTAIQAVRDIASEWS